MTTKVAFIGLGNMGAPMAKNLVNAGFSVTAFDVMAENLQQAVNDGCQAADSAIDAVDGVDYVISMLPSGEIVENLYINQTALLKHIPQNALIIDCSTVAAHNSQRVAREASKLGLHAIDAPVSGGVAAAAAGTLAFMCGGSQADCEKAKNVLSVMGANIFRAGDSGAGQVAKICNNMLLAIHMTGTAEALQLGVNNGLDPAVLSQIMLKSSGCNWSLEKYNPYPGVMENAPASRNYSGGFMVKLMQKDLGLAMETAEASSSYTPMGEKASSLYKAHSSDNNEMLDFSSIQALFANQAECVE